jgi:hypothetical protein
MQQIPLSNDTLIGICSLCCLLLEAKTRDRSTNQGLLLFFLLLLIVHNVVEAEFVDTFGGRYHTEPVTELLLLEVLLCPVRILAPPKPFAIESHIQILEVSARELLVGNDLDLAFALLADDNGVPEVAGPAVDLDTIVQELLVLGQVKDLVVDGLRRVDNELLRHFLALAALLGCGFLQAKGNTVSLLFSSVANSLHSVLRMKRCRGQRTAKRKTYCGCHFGKCLIRKEVVILRSWEKCVVEVEVECEERGCSAGPKIKPPVWTQR